MLENVQKLGCKTNMHKTMGCGLYVVLLEHLVKVPGSGRSPWAPGCGDLGITCDSRYTLYVAMWL